MTRRLLVVLAAATLATAGGCGRGEDKPPPPGFEVPKDKRPSRTGPPEADAAVKAKS